MLVSTDAPVDTPFVFDIASIPLVCTSSDSYYQALKSYYGTHTDGDFCSPKQNYHKFSFCEAVKVDMSKMNESLNNTKTRNSKHKETVAHTMSLVRVLFEDFGVAINIHEQAKDIDVTHPISPLILLNDGFNFDMGIIAKKEYNVFEKECLKSFESLCVFGYREYYKNLLCILVEFYYRISGKKTPVPRTMMEIFGLFNQKLKPVTRNS